MNIGAKGLAVAAVVAGGIIAVAYNVGTTQTEETPAVIAQAGAPSSHPAAPQQGQVVNLFPGQKPKFSHFRVGNRNVKSIMANRDEVWVGTSGGVIRYDLKTNDYKLYDVNNGSLISNGIFHISEVRGKIMIGTYGGGLSVYTRETNQWENYNIPEGLADQFVYDIAEADNGDFWIATWSGLNRVRNGNLGDAASWETFTVENTRGGLPNDWVYDVEVAKNGGVWIATEGGLALYQNNRWTNWKHEDGLGAPFEKVKDDIAFGNDPAKESKHHARQKIEQGLTDIKVGYNPNYIISMVADEYGNVWCGTWGGGLSRFDGRTWKTYTVKEGLPGNHIFMLYKAPGEDMWIGTSKGLARMSADGRRFRVMTKADGLFANNVFSMAEASDGSLWVGSFGGVARITDYK